MANNPYVNKVIYDGNTLIDISDTTASESDVAQGVVFYKADGTRSVGTMSAGAYSFVGMVVSGTNLTTEASVQAIYGSGTSWTLISSVMLSSEHVFGNGLALGLSNGASMLGLGRNSVSVNNNGGMTATASLYGDNAGTSKSGNNSTTSSSVAIGVVTKTEADTTLANSGLVADTITVYSWERTA